jgi:long-chain fatty acid transport protein
LLLVIFLSSFNARGGGFYFPEIATPGSVGTAGAANPTNTFDASTSLTNPAAMVHLPDENSLRVGFQVFAPMIEFDSSIATGGGGDGGNAGDIAAIPGLFYARKINEDLSFGASVSALMGGGIDYGDNFVGRYQATRAVLAGAGVTGSLGYRVNEKLSVGLGVTMVLTQFEQDVAINKAMLCAGPLTCSGNTSDGKVKLEELDDWSPQYVLSLTYQLSDDWLLGAVYRSKVDVDLEGDLRTRNLSDISLGPGPSLEQLLTGNVKLSFDAPEVFEIGLRYQWKPDTLIFIEADIERFSQFSHNYMTVSNTGSVVFLDRKWDDTYRVALGVVRRKGSGDIISAGISYDSSPVDDEDRTFDLPVDEQVRFAMAYGRYGEEGLNYSLAAELIWLGDNAIDQVAQGVRAGGEFESSYMFIWSASVDYRF